LKLIYIEELYDRYYRDVYHFSLYYTNNKQEAEDITQETFIKVMKNLHQLKDPNKQKTWILSIAKNTAIDLKRKQKLIRFLPTLLKEQQPVVIPSQLQSACLDEDWEELQLALLKLKPSFRSIIILRALKELSVKETADVLGCKESKVRVDYHRALIQLNSMLQMKEGWSDLEQSK
jgi:RNA polymerase sigma-70 factor, ECF subfamily